MESYSPAPIDDPKKPAIVVSLDEHNKLKDEAGTLYNTFKSYWPIISALMALSGFAGNTLPPAVGLKPSPTPSAVVSPSSDVSPADIKKVVDTVTTLRKDLDAAVDVIGEQKKIIDKLLSERKKVSAPQPDGPIQVTGVELLRREFPHLSDQERNQIAMGRYAKMFP